MYKGIPFSPQVALADSIGAGDTIIKVTDISAFPDAPNYATIGTDESGETILYAAKTTDSLSGCTRGIEGTAKAWPSGTTIARNFTNKDFEAMQENIRANQTAAENAKKDALLKSGGYMTGPINMNGQSLSGLNAPTEDDEAATKGYADGKLSLELLWQNASHESIFPAQTISLDLSKYQYIMVDTVTTPGAVIIRKGTDADPTSSALNLLVVSSTSSNATVLQVGRRMVVVKSASVAFQDNNSTLYTTTTGSFKAVEASNSSAVPYRIYGIKGVV